jgi:hypothetical protein
MIQVGESHPDRNPQFEYINKIAANYILTGVPVISVDTKKKENIGILKIMDRSIAGKVNLVRY